MAYMRVRSLFVLTLLQLCRAEISDSLPQSWYSANVISDGFQPKPISEIFSTEAPFSSTNPIVVLPKKSSSVPDEILLLSALAPRRKISTTGSSLGDFSKTPLQSSTPLAPTIQTIPTSSLQTIPPKTIQTTPPTFLSTPPTIPDYSPAPAPQQPQIITQFTEQTQPPSQPEFSIQTKLSQTTLSVPQPNFGLQGQLVPQGQSIPGQNLPEQVTTQLLQSQSPTLGPLSNYFLIYQQAPQSIQGFPRPVGSLQEVPQFSIVAQGPATQIPPTVIIQPAPTVSPPTRTTPPTSTTPLPTAVQFQTKPIASTTRPFQNFTNVARTPIPQLPSLGGSLRIRVVAPSGSITNVNFNPTARTTTTRRPTTTRTRKTPRPRKNNYETCTDGCRGRREPICAAPLSTAFLNPDTLKGFPSVCHMACHNSYRKDPYEKVLDGRCGRLRTRIRTVDSNTKLKREELNKAQYFLDNSDTKTIVEFSVLQLCRAEISDSLPQSWYSANVISDGFQPKPISEIFSTEAPFSSTNPIVVLPKKSSSVPDEILLLSALAPRRKISTTGSSLGDFSKTPLQSSTPLAPTIQTIPTSSLQTIPPKTIQTTPPTFLSTPPTIPDYSPAPAPQQPQIITQFTEQTQPPSQPEFSIQTKLSQTTLSVPQPNFGLQGQLVPQGQSIPGQNLPEQVTTQLLQSQSPTLGPLSNYFLIYQQAPQSIQGFPRPVGSLQEVPQFSIVAQGPATQIPPTVIIQPAPTVSPPTRTTPPTSTTPLPTAVQFQTKPIASTTRPFQNFTNVARTPIPQLPSLGGSLRIRVVAPSGSITNVNFNPTARTTTTRRPTTTRTRKTPRPRKNNYETCTDGCRGRREPICAAPLSTAFLNPDTLKGFPSVCHMACHNSYRKDPYEKVLDGRCGRLRTRIRTVDSNTKLKREELNKAQYFLDNSDTKTIVEFSGLNK